MLNFIFIKPPGFLKTPEVSIFGAMSYSRFTEELLEAGCDEAGRVAIRAIFAAAVILPKDFIIHCSTTVNR
jgi:hypothetical protein